MLEGTREWNIGRNGEILTTTFLTHYGFTVLDASSAGPAGEAPMLHRAEINIASPDHLAFRRYPLFVETKTKEQPLMWRGGRNDGAQDHMPPGPAQGIDRRAYRRYLHIQHNLRTPIVLFVLCIETAELRANSLVSLGEPYPSENDRFDMVNWPLRKFALLAEFDRRRLRRYFYDPPNSGNARPAPTQIPSPSRRNLMLDYLRPRQHEIERFREDLITRVEDAWRQP